MNMTDMENQESPFPTISRKAVISFILGLCSLLSLVPFAFLLDSHFDYPVWLPYLILLCLLIWMILPIFAISIGRQAQKISTERTTSRLATAGLILGFLSLLLVGFSSAPPLPLQQHSVTYQTARQSSLICISKMLAN